MKRKIIRQGGGGFTVYLPKKWVDSQGAKAGEEINIEEENSKLILTTKEYKPPLKETTLEIKKKDFHTYRGILGGLYRAGYQIIRIKFDNISIIPLLEKAVNSLYGFEIFDIGKKTCTIKGIYQESSKDIEQYILKMIHIISTIQENITINIKENKREEKEEVFQYRSNVLKYRDLIIRTITQQKLLDDNHFPYYQIAISLWNITRNYNQLYQSIEDKFKASKKDIEILEETNKFVKDSVSNLRKRDIHEKFEEYNNLREKIHKALQEKSNNSLIIATCFNILIATHSADSSIAVLNFARN